MVKVGFIVEGASEKIVMESANFRDFLRRTGHELVHIINAKGGGNLLPEFMESYLDELRANGAEKIFVLTDLENNSIPDDARRRIHHETIEFIFIAVKAMEAWFLADTAAMRNFLQNDDFHGEEEPENTLGMPWDRLEEIYKQQRNGRGLSSKKIVAKNMIKSGFALENAASHQNCPSAKEMVAYFAKSLKSM